MKDYNHLKIEKKWQKEWAKKKAFETKNKSSKKKYYVLDMFPYPSGTGLHVGHPKGYIGSDVFARMKRMEGFNVLHPMGYDAFGLPAEQFAVEHNIHPRKAVMENVKTFEKQLSIIGLSYDWERKVNTSDPEFYKWTQWIFLKIYDSWYNIDSDKAEPIKDLIKIFEKRGNGSVKAAGNFSQAFSASEWKIKSEKEKQDILMEYRLAYEGYSEVNWCPKLGTVLANDEVLDSPNGLVSERGGYPVEKKQMRQWFLRITAYAERLLRGLDTINWSPHIKEIQRNWIGRSDGALIKFALVATQTDADKTQTDTDTSIEVFTTRPDTLFGATYVVLAPEHEIISKWKNQNGKSKVKIGNWNEVEDYIAESKKKAEIERTADEKDLSTGSWQAKTGVRLDGVTAINPANGEEVPVFVADYVLAGYGTGAVMAVPAHDERDFQFAKKYNLPIRETILPHDVTPNVSYPVYLGDGKIVNSGRFDGMDSEIAKKEIVKAVGGKWVTKYKMRDAIFARQRYWGEPIPLYRDKNGIIKKVAEKDLPLKLPDLKSFQPTGTGESPLSTVSSWTKKGYETNTMPGWAGSSWYFLRYMDPKNKKSFADKKNISYWKNVDMYVGGADHATGHLLYSRFWNKVLKDYNLVVEEEPFQTLRNQGNILGADGRKMSKRWGNVVNPNDIVNTYGADTLRVYEMFMGPFEGSLPWSTENIIGSRRFIEKVWRIQSKIQGASKKAQGASEEYKKFETLLHKTIKKVSEDIESMSFNTAVSAMMILVSAMEKMNSIPRADFEKFLIILSPFAPHVSEEIWQAIGNKTLIAGVEWPKADAKKMKETELKIVIQVNSKVRAELSVPTTATETDIFEKALALTEVKKWLEGKEVKKRVYVPGRLVNFVVA